MKNIFSKTANQVKDPEVKYAGFGVRFLAYLIDFILVILPAKFILLEFVILKNWSYMFFMNSRDIILLSLVPCTVIALIISSSWQASIGKRIMGIFITYRGGKIGLLPAIFRSSMVGLMIAVFIFSNDKPKTQLTGDMNESYMQDEQKFFAIVPGTKEILEENHLTLAEAMYMVIPESQDKAAMQSRAYKSITDIMDKKSDADRQEAEDLVVFMKRSQAAYASKDIADYILDSSIFIIMLLLVWYMPVLFTKEKTALHDIIVETRVVYGKAGDYYKNKRNYNR